MESDLDLDFEHYTVAWIAPLEIEAQAALYMLDHKHQGSFTTNQGDDYLYAAGDINGIMSLSRHFLETMIMV
jgi:hypothetical protein